MSLNSTVSSERVHISFFGLRNAGKSSLVNCVTGQSLSVVSDVKGTTTDPVKKSMELLPIGPVVIIDTPGFDDVGKLGQLRVQKTKDILSSTDIAVLVTDAGRALCEKENELVDIFKSTDTPYIIAYNKSDLINDRRDISEDNEIYVSALKNEGVSELKELLGKIASTAKNEKYILKDLIEQGDNIVLVIPIDKAAPKGRLILPQQMTIREILDCSANAIACTVENLNRTLSDFKTTPKLVITDSQAFGAVSEIVDKNIPLTSFSILFARYKGNLIQQVKGAAMLDKLKDGDKILISEGCTHHRQCNDIGTVKMPSWIKEHCKKDVKFEFTSGGEFPDNLSEYALVVHCGGCMLNEKSMKERIGRCAKSGVPVVNYGVAIAHMNSILKRSIELFPEALAVLE